MDNADWQNQDRKLLDEVHFSFSSQWLVVQWSSEMFGIWVYLGEWLWRGGSLAWHGGETNCPQITDSCPLSSPIIPSSMGWKSS